MDASAVQVATGLSVDNAQAAGAPRVLATVAAVLAVGEVSAAAALATLVGSPCTQASA